MDTFLASRRVDRRARKRNLSQSNETFLLILVLVNFSLGRIVTVITTAK